MIFSSARLSAQCSGVLGLLAVYLSSILTFNCSTTHSSLIFFLCFLRFQELGAAWGDTELFPMRANSSILHDSHTFDVRWASESSLGTFAEIFFSRAQRREKRERAEYLLSLCCCQHFLSSSTHPIPFLSISLRWPPFFSPPLEIVCAHGWRE